MSCCHEAPPACTDPNRSPCAALPLDGRAGLRSGGVRRIAGRLGGRRIRFWRQRANEDLPPIDVVVVSHNHYDHLDLRTLERLPGKGSTQLVVPTGVGALVRDLGFAQVHELHWGESLQVGAVRIASTPAIHFSGRGLFDRDATLWAGYVFEAQQQRVFFAGDTAYHPTAFKTLRERIGPVDVALLPIGAYAPRQMMAHVHVDPEEAVAMHWGTIVLSTEPPFEPPKRFRAAGRAAGLQEEALWVMAIG